jgi:predicted ABC-type transport system involved in lysophospholipase L1 biosynthesis ATPase subunit
VCLTTPAVAVVGPVVRFGTSDIWSDQLMLPLIACSDTAATRDAGRPAIAQADERNGHPSRLSGERARFAITRAQMDQPRPLVADEPAGLLDSSACEGMVALLSGIRAGLGTTVVLRPRKRWTADHGERVAS